MLSSPLHPLLVHFPIALLFLGVLVQFLSLWKENYFEKIAFFLLSSGFILGIVAYISGDGGEEYAIDHWGRGVRSIIHTHETYALITLFIFGAVVALKVLRMIKPMSFIKPLVLVLCLGGIITLSLTGHYGGKVVYDHGTDATQESTP